jgi:uncharacterized membrane protein
MLLVFLSHFASGYFVTARGASIREILMWVVRLATPAFVLLSGMMLGVLRYERRADFSPIGDKFIDRGLFLLIVGHPVIALAHLPQSASGGLPWWRALFANQIFITDTLGAALILGAPIAARMAARGRVLLGLCLLAIHWTGEIIWVTSVDGGLGLLQEVLVGTLANPILPYNFPLLPWFAVFLVGSGLGEMFAGWRQAGDVWRPVKTAIAVGFAAIGAVACAKLAFHSLKSQVPDNSAGLPRRVLHVLSVAEKLPPSFGYVFFYGGVALIGIGAAWALDVRDGRRQQSLGLVRRWLSLVGRNSLVAFVLQFFVYYNLVYLLPKPPLWSSPLYFAATVSLLLVVIAYGDKHRLNAYFTVGFCRWGRWRRTVRAARMTDTHPSR